ncbi:chitooligosaccharide deacetylase [Bimuria novae-zelandiae CBS 107.79]|uniref:chitin deacetylase n=1 Tax=Bimuria novae-zelandiae CBS 107.79 TaxID=1447943 RepID=A0A6A5VB19_9PLEO|nr:chitooligosaccharide deacetylase [Bimuria novae-zelandiae CBS 107.79]
MPRPSIRLFRYPPRLSRRARRSRWITMLVALVVVINFFWPFYIIYKPPSLLIQYFQTRWPDVLFHADVKEKVIALTIDDAPSYYTDQILELLKENDAKATFFVIGGQVAGREAPLQKLVEAGMELGNHAMHDEASRSLSDTELQMQMQQVESMIDKAYLDANLAKPARYFRPGSGFFSGHMRKLMKEMGYRLVLGDIYPHDPQISYWRINARHILSMLKPGGIVICHDRRSWTVPMLAKVLPEMKKRGYTITTVSGLLEQAEKEKNQDLPFAAETVLQAKS